MRLPFNKVWRKVAGYRLGYSVQKDYPGRWTTPVVIVVYVALAVVLALMNIPLTAYDAVQEYTYTPNATIPPLPFSYLIPSFLRSRLPDFSPQTLRVGDVLHLNNSVEVYNITSAEVENFLYYNNPLTSCDVRSVTIQMSTTTVIGNISANIACWFPVQFELQWKSVVSPSFSSDLERMIVSSRCWDVRIDTSCDWLTAIDAQIIKASLPVEGDDVLDWTIGGEPHCPGSSPQSASDLTDHLPCDSDPMDFKGYVQVVNVEAVDNTKRQLHITGSNWETSHCIYFQNPICASTYELGQENVFQGVYHYLRRDLGIRSPNQIWASPVVFNATIHALPSDFMPMPWYANEMRANSTDYTWIPWDMDHDTTMRTPKIYYSRWTYRRKSLGSAITSVFVATFTMLAAIWKIFSFIAGLVLSKDDLAEPPSTELESEVRELREEMVSMAEVRASVQELQRMMRYSAPRYGLSLADTGDSTLMESLLSSVDDDDDSKEEDRNGYDRV